MHHEDGYVDPQRLEFARLSVGATVGPWAGVFGTPLAILHPMLWPPARIIKFPERSELAKLRAEIAEISRIVSVR